MKDEDEEDERAKRRRNVSSAKKSKGNCNVSGAALVPLAQLHTGGLSSDEGNSDDDTRSSTSTRSSTLGSFELSSGGDAAAANTKGSHGDDQQDVAFAAAEAPPPSSSRSLSPASMLQSSSPSRLGGSHGSQSGLDSNSNKGSSNPYVPHQLVDLDTLGDEVSHGKRVRDVLRRPFGRTSLGKLARQYCVTVNPPELADDTSNMNNASSNNKVWKYRVWVQQPQLKQATTRQALTTALIDRTLSDFFYLERSLRDEYHGAALIPSLHNYLHNYNYHQQQQQQHLSPSNPHKQSHIHYRGLSSSSPAASSVPNPPPQPLQDFLGDIMNGIRGQGEFYIPPDQILKSRSLEAFLYKSNLQKKPLLSTTSADNDPSNRYYNRNGSLCPSTPGTARSSSYSSPASSRSSRDGGASSYERSRRDNHRPESSRRHHRHSRPVASTSRRIDHTNPVQDAWLQYVFRPLEKFCGGVEATTGFFFLSRADDFSCGDGESTLVTSSHHAGEEGRGGVGMVSPSQCTDVSATDFYAHDPQSTNYYAGSRSNKATPPPPPYSSSNVIHCELLEAESSLLSSYNTTTGSLLEKIQRLSEVETMASQHWRRLATGLQTIFGAEKDTESFKLEDVRVKSPWRKIPRAPVESAIQALAGCYSSRYSASHESLRQMLVAFSSDLDCIPLAMASYRSAMQRVDNCDGDDDDEDRDYDEEDSEEGREPHNSRRLVLHETWLRHTLTAFCRSLPIRTSRMAWRYWNTCASQCAALANSATLVSSQLVLDPTSVEALQKQAARHSRESKQDAVAEMDLLGRIISINNKARKSDKHADQSLNKVDTATKIEVDSDATSTERNMALQRSKVLQRASQRDGRWDSQLSHLIMEATQITSASLEDSLGRDLKRIRKYAIGLREQISRCLDCIKSLQGLTPRIVTHRRDMLHDMAKLFSGKPPQHSSSHKRSVSPSLAILARAGVDTTDPVGWSAALPNYNSATASPRKKHHLSIEHTPVGELAVSYLAACDSHMDSMLESLAKLLREYFTRVEVIEGFVYMECVGIQLERHFSQKRSSALTAFEKKTDITTALNVANRKRLNKLKLELQEKLHQLGDVSHTVVKETKELHLESKSLKSDLHELAMRRLTRARETSTELVVQILSKWAKETEAAAATELKALGEAMATLERAIGQEAALFYPPRSD
jgi:hypothetical protein